MINPKLVFNRAEGSMIVMLTTTMMAVINGDPEAEMLVQTLARAMHLASQSKSMPDGSSFTQTVKNIADKMEKFISAARSSLILPEGFAEPALGENLDD